MENERVGSFFFYIPKELHLCFICDTTRVSYLKQSKGGTRAWTIFLKQKN